MSLVERRAPISLDASDTPSPDSAFGLGMLVPIERRIDITDAAVAMTQVCDDCSAQRGASGCRCENCERELGGESGR